MNDEEWSIENAHEAVKSFHQKSRGLGRVLLDDQGDGLEFVREELAPAMEQADRYVRPALRGDVEVNGQFEQVRDTYVEARRNVFEYGEELEELMPGDFKVYDVPKAGSSRGEVEAGLARSAGRYST